MALMTRPPGEGPYDAPTPPPAIYRPPPVMDEPPLVPPSAAPPPPAAAAPTSEMGAWLAQMFADGTITRAPGNPIATSVDPGGGLRYATSGVSDVFGNGVSPEGGTDFVGTEATSAADIGTPPAAPLYPGAPPWAGDPNIPAPLAMWLRSYMMGGQSTIPQELYDLYGGDAILEAIRKYDPNAAWSTQDMYGGEGGTSAQQGHRLDFDSRTLPQAAGPLGWMYPTNESGERLFNPEMKYYDPIYGWVTDPRNVNHGNNEGLHKWAPYIAAAISMGGPALGAALASAGIGAGVGGTAAVTGGAAGLNAANIAGGGTPTWWSNLLGKAPRTGGSIISGLSPPTNPNPTPARPPAAPAPAAAPPSRSVSFGAPPPLARNQLLNDPFGMQTTPSARRGSYDAYGFDPTAFNSGGSATKPNSGDSKLVATQFTDDPYRFS